jgi:hypothetical protein
MSYEGAYKSSAKGWTDAMGSDAQWYSGSDWGGEDWYKQNLQNYNKYLMQRYYADTAAFRPGDRNYQYIIDEAHKDVATRMNQFKEYLGKARGLAGEQDVWRTDQNRLFGAQVGANTALQVRGVRDAAAQSSARRGLGVRSGLAQAAESRALTGLGGEALNAQNAFASNLEGILMNQQYETISKEFDFSNALEMLKKQEDMEMRLASFQAKLQSDLQSRNAFFSVAGAIGGALAMGLPTGWIGGLLSLGGGAAGASGSSQSYNPPAWV